MVWTSPPGLKNSELLFCTLGREVASGLRGLPLPVWKLSTTRELWVMEVKSPVFSVNCIGEELLSTGRGLGGKREPALQLLVILTMTLAFPI